MSNLSSKYSLYDTIIKMVILAVIVVWCLMILYPFVSVILWSFILGIVLQPLHRFLSNKLGDSPKLASVILVLLILVIFIGPMLWLISALVDEVMHVKEKYLTDTVTLPLPDESIKSIPLIGKKLYDGLLAASLDKDAFIAAHQDQILDFGKSIVRGILAAIGGVVQLILSLIIAGVLLSMKDIGVGIRNFFKRIAGHKGDEFADLTVKTIRSVLNGVLGEGFVLAMLHGVVYVLSGAPYPGVFTLLVFVFAVVQLPAILVSVPVFIYYFATKETMPAVFWTVLVVLVSASDNILTPLMLGKGAPVPMLVIFIGVIGGFILSGFIGLFTGAIVFSLGYKLFVEWMEPDTGIIEE